MPLSLNVDAERWRARAQTVIDGSSSTVVPVTKGNGYGFGNPTLAIEASKLGVSTIAVGEYEEIGDVIPGFGGDALVLSPWRPWISTPDASLADHVIHTVSRLDDLRTLAATGNRPRVVIEVLTSMRRHGIDLAELPATGEILADVQFEGFAFHLPLAGDHSAEVRTLGQRALAAARDAGIDTAPIWLSHVTPSVADTLAGDLGADVRLRMGTSLWLGDRSLLRAQSTVLDLHEVRRGDRYGYRQRRAGRGGVIAVVSGGTAHGVALEAPAPATSLRQRGISLAKGGLEAFGRTLSPFRVAGKQCWFAEPPHMQCSMIWLPAGEAVPGVGDELDVDVRFTTTYFDDVTFAE